MIDSCKNRVKDMLYYYVAALMNEGVNPRETILRELPGMIILAEDQVDYIRSELSELANIDEVFDMMIELCKVGDKESIGIIKDTLINMQQQLQKAKELEYGKEERKRNEDATTASNDGQTEQ